MNELQIFENNEFGKIRTTTIEEKVYFCGNDVAKALGYKDTPKAIKLHCKEDGWVICPVIDNLGRQQEAKFITEGNVYRLIAHSKLPAAEKFEKWVFDEVIPSIRKTGMYAAIDYLQSPQFLIDVAHRLQADQKQIAALTDTVEELAPKASYCDIILGTSDLVPITLIAKDYGRTAQWLNGYLCEKKIQYRMNKTYVLNQKYVDKGYTGTKTYIYKDYYNYCHASTNTLWTQKGRLFIYELLKKDGILPTMEAA